MSTAIAIHPSEKKEKTKRFISLETFYRLYSNRKDGYTYEWNNGIIEKTPRTMNRSQTSIADFLSRCFTQTQAYRHGGSLGWEVAMFLRSANRNRVADMAYLTALQVKEKEDLRPSVCSFVIEIISKNDKLEDTQTKISEYFDNGVKVVWQILPTVKQVHVYTSPTDMKICSGDIVCSASPALEDFNIPAKQIFI